MHHPFRFSLAILLAFGISTTCFAEGQQIRIRGEIEKLDGSVLVVKSTRDNLEYRVKPTADAKVLGIQKISLADIKPGSFIGSAAVPGPDGTLKALELHVFPEDMRGNGEGHRPFDLQPNSTMTNATVSGEAVNKDGKTLSLKYKDGEQKLLVDEKTPVVTYVPGSRSDLKPGVKIIIFSATKNADGIIEAARINFGKDGLTPPM